MVITQLNVSGNAVNALESIASKQIPFAIAKSLTLTAKDAQQKTREQIREKFVIRKKSGGFESSIVIKPATKQNLQAEVYTMAAFTAVHQTGGEKLPHGGRLAIPNYTNIREVKKRNGSAYTAGDAFILKSANGREMIASRKGSELRILYFLRKSADVPKRLNMIETVTQTVQAQFEKHLINTVNKI